MNTNQVYVTADPLGNVIGISQNNPEFGYVRIEQQTTEISEGGWVRPVRRSTLLKGKVEDLRAVGYRAGDTLPGNIFVREQFEPFTTVNPDRHLKIAGNTGVICRVDDQAIYRDTYFTTNPNATDELIPHNNREEIREVQAAQKAMTSLMKPADAEVVL